MNVTLVFISCSQETTSLQLNTLLLVVYWCHIGPQGSWQIPLHMTGPPREDPTFHGASLKGAPRVACSSLLIRILSIAAARAAMRRKAPSYIDRSVRTLNANALIIVCHCCFLYCAVAVLYCTVLYCTVPYCSVLYCAVLFYTVLYCTVLYCTILFCTCHTHNHFPIQLLKPSISMACGHVGVSVATQYHKAGMKV